jgi:hypothetical protein
MPNMRTNAEFKEIIKNRNFVSVDKYAGARTKIRFKCKLDGHVWFNTPGHIIKGQGCPACSGRVSVGMDYKKNKITEDHNSWLLIDISTASYPEHFCKIDSIDFNNIKSNIAMCSNGYPFLSVKGETILLHKYLFPQWLVTDHINRIKTDNRRCNLRECTYTQNSINTGIRKDNKSGTRGVSFDSKTNKWVAIITVNKCKVHYSTHNQKDAAIDARKKAEIKYFGEFAPQQKGELSC